MNQRLMRPAAAVFPLVMLVSDRLDPDGPVAALFVCYYLLQLFTLCSVDAFRNGAAREPGVRRVDRRFGGAWPVLIIGGTGLFCFLRWACARLVLTTDWMVPFAAAACIIIEQMFEERMYALSRNTDGVILAILSKLFLLAGLLVDASGGMVGPVDGFYTFCGAALGAVVALLVSYIIEPMRGFSLVPRNIAQFPKAAVQKLLYPAAFMARLFIWDGGNIFAGLILWELARTVCRRSSDESRPLNLLLIFCCAALVSGTTWLPELMDYAIPAMIALLCAAVVYCAPSIRLYCGIILLAAALALNFYTPIPAEYNPYAIACLCLLAVTLNLHRAFMKKAKRSVYDFGE